MNILSLALRGNLCNFSMHMSRRDIKIHGSLRQCFASLLHLPILLDNSQCIPFLLEGLNCELLGPWVVTLLLGAFTDFSPRKPMTLTGHKKHTLYKLSIKYFESLSLASHRFIHPHWICLLLKANCLNFLHNILPYLWVFQPLTCSVSTTLSVSYHF